MQTDVHEACLPLPFLTQCIEFFDQDVSEGIGRMPLTREEREVVDLVTIRNDDDLAVIGLQHVGLVVVHQVAVEEQTFLGQYARRIQCSAQRRRQPTLRVSADDLTISCESLANDGALSVSVVRIVGQELRLLIIVGNDLPAARHGMIHHRSSAQARSTVHCAAHRNPQLLEKLEQPPHADPLPVLAPGVIGKIGNVAWQQVRQNRRTTGIGSAVTVFHQVPRFQIQGDDHSDAAIIGPAQSQEVQLAGDFGSGRFDYVVGLYYFKEDSEQFLDTITFFAPTETALLPKTESYAAFGQLTYNVTDDFAVMLGGRQSIDKKELVASLGGVDVVRSDRWERFTPKLGLQYKLNRDVLLYASFSEGFKSGGYNGLASNAAQLALPFQPQITRAYEAGIKSDLLDYTLRMNLSVFRNEIEGRQQVINTGDGGFINENYDVRIQGLEAELSWNVFRNLTLWLQGALNDGKYTDLKTSLIGVLGDEIPSLPDYQYTIGFDYSTIAGSGTLSFGSDFMVRDQFYVDAGNTPIAWVPKQELLGAYIGYEIDRWTFKLRGKNLTQTESWQTGFGFSVVQPRIIIDPRTWMFTASYKF